MTDPTQRQVDADIEKSMDLFRRADVGDIPFIDPSRPQRVLVALDGSTQDHATSLLARQLLQRIACQAAYVFVPESDDAVIDAATSDALNSVSATRLSASGDTNYDQILAAAEEFRADLIIVPCPFGRDYQSLGEDSTGTVIDVLTARAKVPFIAVRRPDATGRDPTKHLRIVLTGENPAAQRAASWSVGLVHEQGRLELLLLVEESFLENFREALQSIKPDVTVTYQDLENALARTYGRLHAALQRTASKVGFSYELLVRHEGDERPITPEDPRTHPVLMVVGLERNSHDSQGEVRDFVRRSPHPMLTVSVD